MSPLAVPAVIAGPEAFGRYRVQSKLGMGGMGAVYLAIDDGLGREVAVKVLRPLVMMGEPPAELRERFRREARAVAALTHASVVRVYDQGIEGDLPYLVMELVRGPTLAELMRAGPQPVREMRTLGIQIASALAAAHEAGIVHRDVKPSNILQAGAGAWKLADFGIAQVGDSTSDAGRLTITGQFLGTPAFAAPEAVEGRPVDRAADVYSLGATLYAALAGEPPYGNASMVELVAAMSKRRPTSLLERRPDLPAHIAVAIDRALAAAAEERPTATQLARELARNETPPTLAVADPVVRKGHARTYVLAALVFAAIAVALLFGRAKRGGDASAERPAPVAAPAAATAPAAPGDAASAPEGPQIEPGAPPPWHEALPQELTTPIRGYPTDAQRRWHECYQKLREGDWDSAQPKLEEILSTDPGNETARHWLAWLEAARRDPASFGVVIEED